MRVHITEKDYVWGILSKGDAEVVAETDSYYKVKPGFFFSEAYWVPKTRCEIVRPINEPEIKGILGRLQILEAESNA
jgi:hypothetical protein